MASENILSLLKCGICDELLQETLMCKAGHTICNKCSARVENCPFCRSKLTKRRNIIVEELVAEYLKKETPIPGNQKMQKRKKHLEKKDEEHSDDETSTEECPRCMERRVRMLQEHHFNPNNFTFLEAYELYF